MRHSASAPKPREVGSSPWRVFFQVLGLLTGLAGLWFAGIQSCYTRRGLDAANVLQEASLFSMAAGHIREDRGDGSNCPRPAWGSRTALEHAVQSGVSLAGIEASCLDLNLVQLSGADLRGGDFRESHLVRAELTGAKLNPLVSSQEGTRPRANFRAAVMTRAVLNRVQLSSGILRDAELSLAELRGAILPRADLTGAILRDAELGDADLQSATLTDAILDGADLKAILFT